MSHRTLHMANWILARIVPQAEREALLGDLTEEYALRASTSSPPAALRWYLRQIGASALPLLWARLARGAWISTAGIALLAYVAVGIVELAVHWLTANSARGAYDPLGMLVTFPMVIVIVYFAARLRRSSGIVVAAIMLVSVTAMTVWSAESVPLWYRIAYFFVGPAAAFIGSVLSGSGPAREAR